MSTALATPAVERLADLAGRLRQLPDWAAMEAALKAGKSATVDGAWGSSAALSAAALAQAAPSTLLVVLGHPADAQPWSHDLLSFTGHPAVIFPGWQSWPPEPSPFDEIPGQRLRVVQGLLADTPRVILTTIAALMQPVPRLDDLEANSRRIAVAGSFDLDELADWLVSAGYKRTEAVELPGEFSRRGGILDLYPPDAEDPYRVELFGDEVESIRKFNAASQRSLDAVEGFTVLGMVTSRDLVTSSKEGKGRATLLDYLPAGSWVTLVEVDEIHAQGKVFLERVRDAVGLFSLPATFAEVLKRPTIAISALPRTSMEVTTHLRVESVERFSGNVQRVQKELDEIAQRDRVLVACSNAAEIARLTEIMASGKLSQANQLLLVPGSVHQGFRMVDGGILVLGSHELFLREQVAAGEKGTVVGLPRRRLESRAIDSFMELNDGDYVVHVAHGIALFRGMKMLDRSIQSDGTTTLAETNGFGTGKGPIAREEHLILEFRDGVMLYVPVSKIDLVQKYIGGSRSNPELSKLGGNAWGRKKAKVEEAVNDAAVEMLEIQAARASQTGFSFPPDSDWQKEFEATFPYQETPDQLNAIQEFKHDLERPRPMDRLICGDVGYGKTEVAVRAAFKVADNGKQVAILVPTTVLAEQHYRTFSQRMAEYPITVECLSRFRTATQQKKIVKGVAEGTVDIVVGTHRLVSKDVSFKDLGLVIIDEEQRFGVDHKERLKKLRSMVHILTMTATPIPRTLSLALLGIRDISNLETPPPERMPVETRIIRWDDELIRHAILRELNRDGQIYFVHTRVSDIDKVAQKIVTLVPEARIVTGHGQMGEGELEKAMVKFVRKEAEILVATTIIESGLDIPNANTIFINEADHYGLADLHQLRGRVGRQKNRAYAYLILDSNKTVSDVAAQRLKAIEEFAELGAGFKIAMRDLEIRGAGNILGTEQSGHIATVGYELYCQLLENAVRGLKKMPLRTPLESTVDLPWPAYLPRDYVPGQKLRIEVYRRLTRIRDARKLGDFRDELRERYGPLPEPAEWLMRQTEIRLLAFKWGILGIHRDATNLVMTYRQPRKAAQLCERSGGRMKVIDHQTIYLRMQPGEEVAEATYPLLRQLLRLPSEE